MEVSATPLLRYFFKFDQDGAVINWQVAETEETAGKLIRLGYIEVTKPRYLAHWQALDYLERTV